MGCRFLTLLCMRGRARSGKGSGRAKKGGAGGKYTWEGAGGALLAGDDLEVRARCGTLRGHGGPSKPGCCCMAHYSVTVSTLTSLQARLRLAEWPARACRHEGMLCHRDNPHADA